MTVWGIKTRLKVCEQGTFLCPHCEAKMPYRHMQVTSSFALFGVQLGQKDVLADYIECDGCQRRFAPSGVQISSPKLGHVGMKAA